jgi:hypothetical protein
MEYILEYNPVTGFWHHNAGRYETNTNNFFQISPKMKDTYFNLFGILMEKRFEIKDTRENKKHKNPPPEMIKREFELFMDAIEELEKIKY